MGFLGGDRLIVGYDLGNEYSQISYAVSEEGETETFSQVAGGQSYNIPTVLCKRYGTNQWYYGREALRFAEEGQGILVENLLEMALDGEPVMIDQESFDPVSLLALFFKRSLMMFVQACARTKLPDKIAALMITCPIFERAVGEMLGSVVEGIRLKAEKICFQSHGESFYTYMLHQPRELWVNAPVLFHYRQNGIKVYHMECNRNTTPVVAYVEESEYTFPAWEKSAEEEMSQERKEELDAAFSHIAQDVCGKEAVDSVYLIGDGFAGDWMKDSLRFLCKGRRVFQGNNLFSKGACCGMQERLQASEAGKEHVFLGNDKLKANIGMRIYRQGEESYYALLDAGRNWYESEQTLECYIREGNEIKLTVVPLIKSPAGRGKEEKEMVLEGLRGNIARLRLHLYMEEENLLTVQVEDLGFGEFREASGNVWRRSMPVY